MLRVKCPVCGEWGILRRVGAGVLGFRYVVVHQSDRCALSPTNPLQRFVDEVYRYVRMEE